jgi:hypothetical protein
LSEFSEIIEVARWNKSAFSFCKESLMTAMSKDYKKVKLIFAGCNLQLSNKPALSSSMSCKCSRRKSEKAPF